PGPPGSESDPDPSGRDDDARPVDANCRVERTSMTGEEKTRGAVILAAEDSRVAEGRQQGLLLGVLLLAMALTVLGLGQRPLFDPDETRYAEIPREMIARGDFIEPHLCGVPYLEKPPLGYWLVAAAFAAWGATEWAARFAPAIFSLGTIVLLWRHGSRALG